MSASLEQALPESSENRCASQQSASVKDDRANEAGAEPQATGSAAPQYHSNRLENREATELGQLSPRSEGENTNNNTADPAEDGRNDASSSEAESSLLSRWWYSVRVWWSRQISLTVSHDKNRDHFANERTFLGYLRTSLALAINAVLIAQLFRLQHTEHPDERLGFFALSIPLASLCIGFAICIALIGGYRFWRNQNAMARGKCNAGGWEVYVTGILTFIVILIMFALIIVVNVEREFGRTSS